jgi:hypothetical protein
LNKEKQKHPSTQPQFMANSYPKKSSAKTLQAIINLNNEEDKKSDV